MLTRGGVDGIAFETQPPTGVTHATALEHHIAAREQR